MKGIVSIGEEYVRCCNCVVRMDLPATFIQQLVTMMKSLSKPMKILMLLTSRNWIGYGSLSYCMTRIGWAKEVYGGKAEGTTAEVNLYDEVVPAGSLGLLPN